MKALSALGLALLAGCGLGSIGTTGPGSEVKDLAANTSAKNVALFFGAPTNLAGVHQDIRKNDQLFKDPAYNFGFEVNAINLATKRMIFDTTRAKAAEVGEGGTLLWYFSGHGLENGAMYTEDRQTFFFRDIATEIKNARQTPLKRLVVVIDNCFAGTNLEGNNAIIPSGGIGLTADAAARNAARNGEAIAATVQAVTDALAMEQGTYAADRLYEQALVIAASRSSETSLDGAAGGVFSEAWRSTLKTLRQSSTATLGDMAKQTTEATRRGSGGHHTPVYRAFPSEQVLAESLFGAKPNGGGGTVPTSQPVLSTAVFAALAAADANGDAPLLAAAPSRIASVALCRGTAQQCWAQPQAELAMAPASDVRIDGLTVFRSAAKVQPVEGQDYTLLAYDAAQKLVEVRQLRFQRR